METKTHLSNQEIVEFLFKEKDIARQEIFVNIKVVSQVSLILLPFFFAGIGLLVTNSNVGNIMNLIGSEKLALLLILINQILFLLWMYGLSIVCNLAALGGYIMALEEKINHYCNHEITTWESVIQPKYIIKWNNGQFISTFFWNLFYFILFLYITVFTYSYSSKQNWLFFIINCVEIVIIIVVFTLTIQIRKKSYELSKLKAKG